MSGLEPPPGATLTTSQVAAFWAGAERRIRPEDALEAIVAILEAECPDSKRYRRARVATVHEIARAALEASA